MNVFNLLIKNIKKKGTRLVLLIDPDKKNKHKIDRLVEGANSSNLEAIFVGGSLIMDSGYHRRVKIIKEKSKIPVILFPGSVNQINKYFDAVLFMSLISGRNPQFLIGDQVVAAPIIKDIGVETISTGYMLLGSNSMTSAVSFMSNTRPIPSNRVDIAVAHALAGQYLGLQSLYLEAGSGAEDHIPLDIIREVSKNINIPLIIGGGIKSKENIVEISKAGASLIVVSSAFEESIDNILKLSSALKV